jgi:[SSU ribosomal protein S18P]-alanine acetyltransferase (EC 2.3.1.128)
MLAHNVEIRTARFEDLEQIIEINRRSLPENYSYDYFVYHLRDFGDLFLVASIKENDKEKIVGYVMNRIEIGLSNFGFSLTKKGHVISIAVLEEYRRLGIGFSLMKHTIERFKKYNISEVYLEVRVTNYPAINLYKKLNFEIVKVTPNYYSDGEDAYIMSLRLKEAKK